MTDQSKLFNNEVDALWQQCLDALSELVERARTEPAVRDEIQELIFPEDTIEAFKRIGMTESQLEEIAMRSSVAALVNTQSVKAIEAEQSRRSRLN